VRDGAAVLVGGARSAERLRADRDRPGLWRLIRSLPLPQAVTAARHLRLRERQPPDGAEQQLAHLLVDATSRRWSGSATRWSGTACTHAVPDRLESLCPAAFAFRAPVAGLKVLDVVRRAAALRPAPVEQARRKARTRWWSR
jgi:hypothetical protein